MVLCPNHHWTMGPHLIAPVSRLRGRDTSSPSVDAPPPPLEKQKVPFDLAGAPFVMGAPQPPAGVPPVHPSAQPAAPKLSEPAAAPEKPPTGAHAPDSGDSYAFGEPRCNGDYRPKGKKSDAKTTIGNSLLGLPVPNPPPRRKFVLRHSRRAERKRRAAPRQKRHRRPRWPSLRVTGHSPF
jgi:hypothetical protein